jgi:hypothetical protein
MTIRPKIDHYRTSETERADLRETLKTSRFPRRGRVPGDLKSADRKRLWEFKPPLGANTL